MSPVRSAALVSAAVALLLSGCAAAGGSAAPSAPPRTLTVAAAASLQGAFSDIAGLFEDAHEGVAVELAFAGSSSLVAQLAEGAPGDVFASADEDNMRKAADAGLVGGAPVVFARNTLRIVTPPGNPAGIGALADIARPGVDLVVCAAQVPCGAATAAVAREAGLTLAPASEEQSVTDVLARVASGEADAGLVYVTDAEAEGDAVHSVPFDEAADIVSAYPIVPLADAAEPDLAADFVAFVTGDEGQAVLASYGFLAP